MNFSTSQRSVRASFSHAVGFAEFKGKVMLTCEIKNFTGIYYSF